MPEIWSGFVWRALLVVTLLASWFVVRRLEPERRWLEPLHSRFYLGIPWGSALSLGLVLFVYLVVQEGATHWHHPLAIPFSAWSYFYPLGWLLAGFAHAGPGHLISNLTSAVILAPLAEYVWGHYPETGTGSWYADPRLRAFVVFPAAVVGVSVVTSLFSWGPVIGFSASVFAFAGFVLVRYPLVAVIALAARGAIRTVVVALGEPLAVVETTASVSPPWWYGIAVQGHALGFLLGVLAGIALLHRRELRTDPLRLWVSSLLVCSSLSLWAIWWVRGESTFVLYRALGVVLVVALATAITVALAASDRPLLGRLTRRQAAAALLVVPLVGMCLVAVPLNLSLVEAQPPEKSITAGEYAVFYDEDVSNQLFSIVEIEAFGETTDVTTSGVIVINEERQVWGQEVSKTELETHGEGTIRIGGLTWSETIEVEREGWVVGDNRIYRIWFDHGGERTLAYTSDPVTVPGYIDGREVAITADDEGFHIALDGTVRAPMPDPGGNVRVDGVRFARVDDTLYAEDGDTVVPIAEEESYAPRQEDR